MLILVLAKGDKQMSFMHEGFGVKGAYFHGIISKDDLNTGRQIEFDYSKGLFMFAILFVHAFQVLGKGMGKEAYAYKLIYMVCTMTGASIFMFVMGLGTKYSRAGIKDMVISGFRLIGYQYFTNIACVAALVLPYFILQFFTEMSSSKEAVVSMAKLLLFYINIFFLAGGIYWILALLRKMKIPVWLYVVLGLLINIFSPSWIGLSVGNAVFDYILGSIFGGTSYASFSILNFLPYAFFGLAFGDLLRKVIDKKRFYTICCYLSIVVLAVFLIWVYLNHKGFDALYDYIGSTYTRPDFMRTIANTACVILLAGALFFARGLISGLVDRQLMYISKHISKYYVVHQILFFLALGLNKYHSMDFWGCLALFVLGTVCTDGIVRFYNHVRTSRVSGGIERL